MSVGAEITWTPERPPRPPKSKRAKRRKPRRSAWKARAAAIEARMAALQAPPAKPESHFLGMCADRCQTKLYKGAPVSPKGSDGVLRCRRCAGKHRDRERRD